MPLNSDVGRHWKLRTDHRREIYEIILHSLRPRSR